MSEQDSCPAPHFLAGIRRTLSRRCNDERVVRFCRQAPLAGRTPPGRLDLVAFFSIPEIRNQGALDADSTAAELFALTSSGELLRGTDSVFIVG